MKRLMTKLKFVAMVMLMAALAGAGALPAQADTISGVSYRYPTYETSQRVDPETYQLVETITGISGWNEGTADDVTVVGSEGWISGIGMGSGWYVVTNDVTLTLSRELYVSGDVHLILADGAKLTISSNDSSCFYLNSISDDCSLTIYGQSKGTGRLVASSAAYAILCYDSKSTVVINGGDIKLEGGSNAIARSGYSSACIRFNGGIVRAISSGADRAAISDPFYLNRSLVLRFGAAYSDQPEIYRPDVWDYQTYADLVESPTSEYDCNRTYINVPNVAVYTSVPTGQPCSAAEESFSVLEGRTLYAKFTINTEGWQFPNGSDTCYQEFVAEDNPTYVTLSEANYPVRKTTTVVPGTTNHVSAAEVYTNGTVAVTGSSGNYPVLWGDTVRLIWTVSDAGYVFSNGATVYTNDVTASGTTMNVAAPKASSTSAIRVCSIGEMRYESIADALAAITGSSATTITLLTNVTENVTIAASRNITFDLNGFVWKGTGSGTVIRNPNGSTLTLTDTRTGDRPRHYFTEGDNNLWVWNGDAAVTDFYVDGGLVTGGKGSNNTNPGGVYANGGTLTMRNIAIVGNQVTSGSGGGIRAGNSCTLTITGCKLLHNYAASSEGGAIVSPNNTKVCLYDCEVIGNRAGTNGGAIRSWYGNGGGSFSASNTVFRANVSGQAGGVYSGTTPATFTDCDISGNTSGTSGAIVNTAVSANLWYPVTVAGTTSVTNNTGGNVYLASGKVLTVANGFCGKVGVTTATAPTSTTPVSITGSCAADVHTHFVADNASYSVVNAANNVVQLSAVPPVQAVTFTPTAVDHATAAVYTNGVEITADGGAYTITSNVTATVVYTAEDGYCFADGATVVTNTLDTTVDPATVKGDLPAVLEKIDDTPIQQEEKTDVVPVEKPTETQEEVWEAATNIVNSVETANASAIVADEVLTNAVTAAKAGLAAGETLTKVLAEVTVTVTPTGATADDANAVRAVAMDVTPTLTTRAVVESDGTVTTNDLATTSEFAYSGNPMSLTFDVSSLADTPMLVVHEHGTTKTSYTRGEEPGETTFSYDTEAKTITLLMSSFSPLTIYANIQVGEDAWATVSGGVCTITGTGDMWGAGDWTAGNPLAAFKNQITSLVVESGVESIGEQAFHKFYALTNVTCAASVRDVGDYAFYRCNSLEKMSFATTDPVCFGFSAYTLQVGIYMKDGMPEIYPIPEIEMAYPQGKLILQGTNDLGDSDSWTEVTEETKKNYHFFRYVVDDAG